jgi:predicted MFS family arabinose efflux permease
MKLLKPLLQPPLVAVLALTAMIGWLNSFALSPFLPDMADDLGTTVPLLGQATSIIFFLGAGVSIFAGPVADARGCRRLLIGGLLAVVVSALGTALATSYWMLVCVRLTAAFSTGALAGLALAVAANAFEGNDRRRALSWVSSGVAGGAIAGIPLLTIVGSLGGWRLSFVSLAAVGLILIALVRWSLPDDAKHDPVNARSIVRAYAPLARSPGMLALYLAFGLRSICWTGFFVYAGAYYSLQHGLDVRGIGWAYMLGGIGFFLGLQTTGSTLGDRPLRPVFVGSTAFTGLTIGALLILPVGLFTAVALMTVAVYALGISTVCTSTLLAAETPTGRGTTMSLNSAVLVLATALGGAVGGVLIALGGFTMLGVGLVPFSLLAAIIVLYGSRVPKRTLTPSETQD